MTTACITDVTGDDVNVGVGEPAPVKSRLVGVEWVYCIILGVCPLGIVRDWCTSGGGARGGALFIRDGIWMVEIPYYSKSRRVTELWERAHHAREEFLETLALVKILKNFLQETSVIRVGHTRPLKAVVKREVNCSG